MKFKKFLICGAIVVGAAGVFSASVAAAADNTLTWPTRYSFSDWDPAATYSEESYVLGNIYETLTFYVDGEVKPRLATSWEKSDGGKTWTFQLREGVKFHDGADLNAETVKQSVEWAKAEGRGATFLWGGLTSVDTPASHCCLQFQKPHRSGSGGQWSIWQLHYLAGRDSRRPRLDANGKRLWYGPIQIHQC